MSGPNIWGPHGWKFIHYVTLGYPINPTKENKEQYYNFFNSIKYVIPCSICGNHYREHIKQYPLTDSILSNKNDFINWGIQMHNLVNLSNNKKVFNNEDGLKEIIKNCTGDCPGNSNIVLYYDKECDNKWYKSSMLYIILLLVIIIIYLVYKYI